MGKINSENLWMNAQAGYAAYSNAMQSKRATNPAEQAESVNNLVRYLEDKPIAEQNCDTFTSTVSGSIPVVAVFEAPRGIQWLKHAKGVRVNEALEIAKSAQAGKDAVSCAAKLREYGNPVKQSLKEVFTGSGKVTQRVGNYFNSVAEFQGKSSKLTNAMGEFYAKEHPNKVLAFLKKVFVKKSGKAAEEAVKAAETVEKTSKFSGALNGAKSILAKPFTKVAAKFPTLGKIGTKAGKVFKGSGAGAFAVFQGGIEFFTEIRPTFKELGTKAGIKQIGKSAVKVAADVGGWTVGAKAGAAAGAAIGSIFPGIGTAIGAAVGTVIGGFIGSWGAGKIAKAVTGPSERELAQQKQDKEQTEAIQNNEKDLETLKQLAYEKVQQTAQENGYLDADSQKALEEIEKLNNPFAKGAIYA